MSPMRFNRVAIVENSQTIEYGTLNQTMPQSDLTYLYEIYGDSGRLYILKEENFIYIHGEEDDTEWQGF